MVDVRIIDRRYDSRNKSTVNRGRFIRRFKEQIRGAVADAIARRGITDIDRGEKIDLPARDISEPQFHQSRHGGVWRDVLPGNDRFGTGDEADRPKSGAGGKGSEGSPDGDGVDDFTFTLSRDEFLNIFFDDLALPNLIKTQLSGLTEYKQIRAGYTHTGVPSNINIVRSLRGATGRRIAGSGPYRKELRELRTALTALEGTGHGDTSAAEGIRGKIDILLRKIDRLPFIDTFDLRYNSRVRIPQPSAHAVMFCLMDVSGSMTEEKKQMAKRFFMLLYLFLTRSYEHIDVVFIRHHTQAEEVDEDSFFHSRESGGTVVSSALDLMHSIIVERYASNQWNVYGAQASDGENWSNDSPRCKQVLETQIVPLVQHYAYIEITSSEPQNLWQEYEKVALENPQRFAMQRISGLEDIYPVFRELFRKKLA